jgi:membrane protein
VSTTTFGLRGLRDREQLKQVGQDLAAEIKSDDVASLAAAVSFKIVLALFPALLAAVAIFALVVEPEDLEQLLTNVPAELTEVVQGQLDTFIQQAASGGIAVTGIAVGIWAASGAAATLNKALSRAYDLADDRKIVPARAAALGVTVALLLALVAISILLVAGGSIENDILASLPLADTARSWIDALSTVGRYVAAILLLMLLFAFIYWIGPDYEQRPRWRWITPGAALAVVVWLLASGGFGWYVANFGSYTDSDSPYGPLGSAIVFMLWLQLSMFALLLGAEVNQVLRRRVRRVAAEQAGAGHATRTDDDAEVIAGDTGRPLASDRSGGRPGVTDDRKVAPSAAGPGTTRNARSGRPGARVPLEADGTDDVAPTAPGSFPVGARTAHPSTHGQALDVRGHERGARQADDGASTPAGNGTTRVPAATVAGAAVAGVSSVVGLIGLLRRLRGG